MKSYGIVCIEISVLLFFAIFYVLPYGAKFSRSIICAISCEPRKLCFAKFSKTRTLPQLQLVGDRSMVLYRKRQSDDKLSNPRGLFSGIGSTETRDLEPVKNGWYAKVAQSKNIVA